MDPIFRFLLKNHGRFVEGGVFNFCEMCLMNGLFFGYDNVFKLAIGSRFSIFFWVKLLSGNNFRFLKFGRFSTFNFDVEVIIIFYFLK